MRFLFSVILTFIFALQNFAQDYDKIVVTDVKYLARKSSMLSLKNFPMYFHEPLFIADLHKEIEAQAKAKFRVDTVQFSLPDTVEATYYEVAQDLRIKEIERQPNSKTLYLAIETILQFHGDIEGELVYYFTTRIKAFNSKGKKVFSHKTHIPFVVMIDETISGKVEFAEQDFYQFYFDGLIVALEGKEKRLPKRYVYKPATNHYNEFLEESEKFYLIDKGDEFLYGIDPKQTGTVLEMEEIHWKKIWSDLELFETIYEESLLGEFSVSSKMDEKEYRLKYIATNKSFLHQLSYDDFKIEFLEEKDSIGTFYYDPINGMSGIFREDTISIKWKPEYQVLEYCEDDKLIALVKELGDITVLYINRRIKEDQLTTLFNLYFAYINSVDATISWKTVSNTWR